MTKRCVRFGRAYYGPHYGVPMSWRIMDRQPDWDAELLFVEPAPRNHKPSRWNRHLRRAEATQRSQKRADVA